jgi:hypothetical protein
MVSGMCRGPLLSLGQNMKVAKATSDERVTSHTGEVFSATSRKFDALMKAFSANPRKCDAVSSVTLDAMIPKRCIASSGKQI